MKPSLTNLFTKIKDLEAAPDAPTVTDRAKQLLERLESLDRDFRAAHLNVIDATDEDSPELDGEHEVLDRHEEDVSEASLSLQGLMKPASRTNDTSGVRLLSRKLSRAERCLRATEHALSSIDPVEGSVPLLEQHHE